MKIEGIKDVKLGKNKFFYEMKILENKPLLPGQLRKVAKALEDYGYVSFEVKGLAGTVEKSGDGYVFTGRGSKQAYGLTPSAELKKLVEAGKTSVTLTGKILQEDGKDARPSIEVTEAKETAK